MQFWLKRFPLGRVTLLPEIARTVALLSSDNAGGITGSFITVDAGFMARQQDRIFEHDHRDSSFPCPSLLSRTSR